MSMTLALLPVLVVALSACGGGTNEARSPAGDRALIDAARAGDADRVRTILEEGADVHARETTGATALVAAAHGNHLDAAGALIEAGADVNTKDETQQSAYLIATSEVGDDTHLLELTLPTAPTSRPRTATTGLG